MDPTDLINTLEAKECAYYSKKMISFKDRYAKAAYQRGLEADRTLDDRLFITGQTVYEKS